MLQYSSHHLSSQHYTGSFYKLVKSKSAKLSIHRNSLTIDIHTIDIHLHEVTPQSRQDPPLHPQYVRDPFRILLDYSAPLTPSLNLFLTYTKYPIYYHTAAKGTLFKTYPFGFSPFSIFSSRRRAPLQTAILTLVLQLPCPSQFSSHSSNCTPGDVLVFLQVKPHP